MVQPWGKQFGALQAIPTKDWNPDLPQFRQPHLEQGTMATNGTSNGAASKNVPLWIAGQEVQTDTTFDVISPTNSEKLWSSSSVSAKLGLQAVEAAQTAFKTWRRTKPAEVRKILLKAADIFEARQEELAGYMKQETGALDAFAQFNMSTTIENLRDVAGRPASILGAIPTTATPGQEALIFKERRCLHAVKLVSSLYVLTVFHQHTVSFLVWHRGTRPIFWVPEPFFTP